ncbi:putative Acetolactate synthase isozyme 2 large subunit [Magnetospirillum molischianum DSM 120]|uniref:Putative Acetolactate synthase isozyme 2 large subunit n=2 Tax=Magnetospirillum molischianum TaxID=1083 RepID=H8FRR8_MAGML|nr:putative Acetolactate synthase isozyme 2 large subunit [Magnetospirillum molischianum DSM 120]
MIDAIARQPGIDYFTHFNERSAALAANAVWHAARRIGVAMASGGPSATNMVTGIACAYHDSVPTLFITGQSDVGRTPIAAIVAPIVKAAFEVAQVADLPRILDEGWDLALAGRPGPVLIDIPVAVQAEPLDQSIIIPPEAVPHLPPPDTETIGATLTAFLAEAERPLLLLGGGVGRAGCSVALADWLRRDRVPFVASWSALSCFDHDLPSYLGAIGRHGNRGANFALWNCDRLLVLGSHLDDNLRSSDPRYFAPAARIHVIDIDAHELTRLATDRCQGTCLDLRFLPQVLDHLTPPLPTRAWHEYLEQSRSRYFGRDISTFARTHRVLSPYAVMQRLSKCLALDAVVIGDTGANLCWLFQMFHRRRHSLFAAGSHAPAGYALPAAIGAVLEQPRRQVVAMIGDGGLQSTLEDLQTLAYHHLGIAVVVFNNSGYGLIKYDQNQTCGGRHEATGRLYSVPNFDRIASAFGIEYRKIEHVEQIGADLFLTGGPILVEISIAEEMPVEPQIPPDGQISRQVPDLSDEERAFGSRFVPFGQSPPS